MELVQAITLATAGAYVIVTILAMFRWKRRLNVVSVCLGAAAVVGYVIQGSWVMAAVWVAITGVSVGTLLLNRHTARRTGGAR